MALTGFFLFVFGIEKLWFVMIYVAVVLVSAGSLVLYLTMLITLKHFPRKYLSSYFMGHYLSGLLISFVYLGFSKLKLSFAMVIFMESDCAM